MAVQSPMPIGKQVFLLGIGAIPTVMRCMTPAVSTVKKAAVGGKKSPAGAGTKTTPCRSPSPALPKGREPILAVFEAVWWDALPLGRVGEGLLEGWGGAFGLGRGLSVVLTLNTIIPASTWTDGNDLWVNYEKCIDAAMLNSILGGYSFHRNVRCAMYQLRCYLHLYKSCNT